jgi:uncharacterized protein YndB with AHSA1/START domain
VAASKLEIIAEPDRPTIVTRRVVNAPRSLVFDAFTKPEHLKRWMGPRSLTMTVCEVDLRVGGKWRMVHRTPDGQEFGLHGEFREIVRPERIVRTFVFEPLPEHEALETLVLEEHAGLTTVTTTSVHKTIQGRDGHLSGGRMEAGMTDGYARLDDLLGEMKAGVSPCSASKTKPAAFVVSRVFNAPRRLVWEAWTKAEHIEKWFTPKPLTTPRCEVDFRVGGIFYLVMRMPNGTEFPMNAKFTEIVPLEKIVFVGEIHDGNEAETTVTFIEEAGKTTLTARQTYAFESDATRGAPQGWKATLDQLGEHVRKL